MKLKLLIAFVVVIQIVVSCVDGKGGRGGRGRGGGGGFHPRSNHYSPPSYHSPPYSHQIHSSGGSTPNKIGWNPASHNYQPSAPIPNHFGQPSTNHQTGYHPSGGYGPNTGGGFGQQSNHNVRNSAPHPSYGVYGYNSYTHPQTLGNSHPPVLYNPQVGAFGVQQPIVIPGASSRPSFSQSIKEGAGFALGGEIVRALVNRHDPHYYSHGSTSSGTHNTVTNNNYYYNNGIFVSTSKPVASDKSATNSNDKQAANVGDITTAKRVEEELKFTSPKNIATLKHELEEFTEILLTKDVNNVFKQGHITMDLKGLKTSDSITDDAPNNLLSVKAQTLSPDVNITTFKTLFALYDNYELDILKNEDVTIQQRNEESEFIDEIVKTDVIIRTKDFLVQKGYLSNDDYEFKNALKSMWFTRFERVANIAGGSGFEYVFLAEKLENKIIGLHNWIYYAKHEADKQLNYLGYIGTVPLGDYGSFIKVKSSLNDSISEVTTLFVGLSPELEISLYTLCFYISPNYPCPIRLSGHQFSIIATRRRYFDKHVLLTVDVEFVLPPPPPSVTQKSWHFPATPKPNNSPSTHNKIFQTEIHLLLLILILFKLI